MSSVIIGIDPGSAVTGYGIIRQEGSRWIAVDYGCVRPPRTLPLSEKYLIIFNALISLLESHTPDMLVVETQYMRDNAQTALKLGMIRGIVILAAKLKKMRVYQYTPKEAKRALGNGNYDKKQVQWMIQQLLSLQTLPPQDASDALALALCHGHRSHLSFLSSKEV
jgi:crossover junction endodeoxyribonuclease RuvC